jgi:FixJ family two-component response regulator
LASSAFGHRYPVHNAYLVQRSAEGWLGPIERSDPFVIQESESIDPIVYVVDDDAQSCRAVAELIQSFGHRVRSFESPNAFLDRVEDHSPGCVVLDLRMPSLDGSEVQRRLIDRGMPLSVILLTAYADVGMTVHSLRSGAIAVLEKPCRDDELWNCVHEAIVRSEHECRRKRYLKSMEQRFCQLTESDRAVLQLILKGMKNRSIANRISVSLRTVENRRRRVFDVMKAGSLAELTRMVVEFENDLLPSEDSDSSWMTLPHQNSARAG